MMKKQFCLIRTLVIAVIVCLLFAACKSSDDPPASSSVVVTPSLGMIIGADVKATKPDGTQLGLPAKTDATGKATISFSGYSGPMIVEVAGNATATYFDEALGVNTALETGEKLHAALDSVKSQIGVTPLTEIGFQYAVAVAGSTASLTANSIKTANDAVRQTLASEIADITAPPTLVSTSTASGALDASDASKYAAKLAALAKLAQATGGVTVTNPALAIAKQLAEDLKDGVLDGKNGSTALTGTATYTVASLAADLKTQIMTYTTAFGNAALQTLASGGTLSIVGSGSIGVTSLCDAGYVGATATTGITVPGTCGTVTYCVSQTNPTVSAYYLIGSTKIAVDLTKLINGTTVNITYAQQLGLDIAAACTGSGSTGGSTSDSTAPTVTGFEIPTTSTSLTVAITAFTATDTVGVTGYLLTESATAPAASAAGWAASAPANYTFTTEGSKTLYAWAKDAAGNVSAFRSATVAITLGGSSGGSGSGSVSAPLTTASSYTLGYTGTVNGQVIGGLDTRTVSVTIGSSGQMTGYINILNDFTKTNEALTLGTALVSELGGNADVTWGRWNSGQLGGKYFETSLTPALGANQGFHYVVGNNTAILPTTGTATYTTIIGATATTLNGPTGHEPGSIGSIITASSSLVADFASGKAGFDISLNFGGDTYRFQSSGGTVNVTTGAAFASYDGIISASAGAAVTKNGTAVSPNAYGYLIPYGANARYMALVYSVNFQGVAGVVVFDKGN